MGIHDFKIPWRRFSNILSFRHDGDGARPFVLLVFAHDHAESIKNDKQVPFKNLFFTGLVLDKDGHKFSKSRGNGIDPLLMIEKFGADALRMSLIMDSAPGQDSRLYEEKIETFRNFANKLWNISRFCLTQENFKLVENIGNDDIKTQSDEWIVYRLQMTIDEISRLFESKQIAVAADVLKTFT